MNIVFREDEASYECIDVPLSSFQCRICLENQADPNDNPLIAPCACSGSVRYVHSLCLNAWLTSWISRQGSVSLQGSYGMYRCEMCRHKIIYERSFEFMCRGKEKTLKLITERFLLFLINIIIIGSGIGLLGVVLSILMADTKSIFEEGRTIVSVILLGCAVVILAIIAIAVYIWARAYFLTVKEVVGTILNRRSKLIIPQTRAGRRVIPSLQTID